MTDLSQIIQQQDAEFEKRFVGNSDPNLMPELHQTLLKDREELRTFRHKERLTILKAVREEVRNAVQPVLENISETGKASIAGNNAALSLLEEKLTAEITKLES